jgi:hypothetical protein
LWHAGRKRIYDENVYGLMSDEKVRRGFMKNISSTLLALVFVFFSLISLLSVNWTWDNSLSQLGDSPSRVSELGLRFAMQR